MPDHGQSLQSLKEQKLHLQPITRSDSLTNPLLQERGLALIQISHRGHSRQTGRTGLHRIQNDCHQNWILRRRSGFSENMIFFLSLLPLISRQRRRHQRIVTQPLARSKDPNAGQALMISSILSEREGIRTGHHYGCPCQRRVDRAKP